MSERETVGWAVRHAPDCYEDLDGDDNAVPKSRRHVFRTREEAVTRCDYVRREYGCHGAVVKITRRAKTPEPQPRMVAVEDVLAAIDEVASSAAEGVKVATAREWWGAAFEFTCCAHTCDILRKTIRALAERKS